MAIISVILMAAGFFGYIISLTVDTHFAYKSVSKKEKERSERASKAARTASRLCLAAFIFGMITLSSSFGK